MTAAAVERDREKSKHSTITVSKKEMAHDDVKHEEVNPAKTGSLFWTKMIQRTLSSEFGIAL